MRADPQDNDSTNNDEDEEHAGISTPAAVLLGLILVLLALAATFAVAYLVSLLGTLLSKVTPLTPFQGAVIIVGVAVGGVALILLGRMANRLGEIETTVSMYVFDKFASRAERGTRGTRRR